MTVCIAALFTWYYGTIDSPEPGIAVVTASDRMLTSGDIQYEPPQLKLGFLTQRTLALVSGEIPMHSDIMSVLKEKLDSSETWKVQDIAHLYADTLIAVRANEAARVYLGPLGLNLKDFVSCRHGLLPDQVADLTRHLQTYAPPLAEALVVGVDDNAAEIFNVDQFGAHRQTDVTFVAIGAGAPHANLHFMRSGHSIRAGFSQALATTYAAKKVAEIAAGVGNTTDMYFITRVGWSRVADELMEVLRSSFAEYEKEKLELDSSTARKVQDFMDARRLRNEEDF